MLEYTQCCLCKSRSQPFVREREGELRKEDLLAKATSLDTIVAFAVALKHRLGFEPYTQYDGLQDLVSYLDTFAKHAGSSALMRVSGK